MYGDLVQPPRDRRVVALADRQHGVLTRSQLGELGLGKGAIDARIRAGWLWRVHQGVYAVGRRTLTSKGRFLAAVLSCGPSAALSHVAAAILWGLLPDRGWRIDVTVPRGGGRRRRGALIIHRSTVPPNEVTVKDGIAVTTPARTLIDLADVLGRRRLERAFDEAAFLRLELAGLRVIPGRRGAGVLRRVLAEHTPGSTRTRSELEESMLAVCRSVGLPPPEVNVRVEGHTVDFAWPGERLIVEADSWQAHGTRSAFERDRQRDADLIAAGWRTLRVSYRRLESDPEWVADRIAGALRAAG